MNKKHICPYCLKEADCFELPTCRHVACQQCWSSWILQAISSKKDFIVCLATHCKQQITDKFIKQVLPYDTYSRRVIQPVPNLIALFSSLVKEPQMCTNLDYIHYACSGEYDVGWGCAYRVLQMVLSCLIRCGALPQHEETVPSIGELQRAMAHIGRLRMKDIYSHKWIEPPDAGAYLRHICKLKTEECVFYRDVNGESLRLLTERLKNHFKTSRTPVMIDDTIKAYALVGYGERISASSVTEPLLLRFDPHVSDYTKYEDYQEWIHQSGGEVSKIPSKGGVQWLTPSEIFISQRQTDHWLILFTFKEANSNF